LEPDPDGARNRGPEVAAAEADPNRHAFGKLWSVIASMSNAD
jgi:hypothetical protein